MAHIGIQTYEASTTIAKGRGASRYHCLPQYDNWKRPGSLSLMIAPPNHPPAGALPPVGPAGGLRSRRRAGTLTNDRSANEPATSSLPTSKRADVDGLQPSPEASEVTGAVTCLKRTDSALPRIVRKSQPLPRIVRKSQPLHRIVRKSQPLHRIVRKSQPLPRILTDSTLPRKRQDAKGCGRINTRQAGGRPTGLAGRNFQLPRPRGGMQ
jgi:hypothetical protein